MTELNIVNLDAFAANPGDLSWDAIARLGNLTTYPYCPNDKGEVVRRCQHAHIVLTNKIRFTDDMMAELPKLKLIVVQATGYNIIDTRAARARGIAVCNVPGYSTDSVAQLVFAFILEFFSGVGEQDDAVKAGKWSSSPTFTFFARPILELAGKTLGVFGFGTIGQKVAQIANAFGMKVIYCSRTPKQSAFATPVTLEDLFRRSDILTLHAPMTDQTACVVNREHLALMKPSAFIVNTARGGLVDDQALADALNGGEIAGAAVDVLSAEPPQPDHPLLHAQHILVTPHTAWASLEARKRLIAILEENIRAFIAGTPVNVIN